MESQKCALLGEEIKRLKRQHSQICPGSIESYVDESLDEIILYCPLCESLQRVSFGAF